MSKSFSDMTYDEMAALSAQIDAGIIKGDPAAMRLQAELCRHLRNNEGVSYYMKMAEQAEQGILPQWVLDEQKRLEEMRNHQSDQDISPETSTGPFFSCDTAANGFVSGLLTWDDAPEIAITLEALFQISADKLSDDAVLLEMMGEAGILDTLPEISYEEQPASLLRIRKALARLVGADDP